MMSSYNLVEVCDEVYNSTKEILKRNQRHLFTNMLMLLSKTTKTSVECNSSNFPTEKYVKFWYTEILPLVFDKDAAVQKSAISAIETAIDNLDTDCFQKHSDWNDIKVTIVEDYSKEIHNLRDAQNSNWYKIWCILMRILNAEILKSAKIINTFLTIVELAFRSVDYNVRAEAFLCWKTLTEIFYKNNEISSQKRIKLLCIPLKPSPSKTEESAINKIKVWWYLITKIHMQIDLYIVITFDSFLRFCFGGTSNGNNSIPTSAKTYNRIKEMATMCFLSMLGCTNMELQKKMSMVELEPLQSGIINQNIMRKSWKIILHSALEITRLHVDDEITIKLIWEHLQPHIFKLGTVELHKMICKNLQELAKENKQLVTYIVKEMGSHEHFPYELVEENNDNDYSSDAFVKIMNMFLDLIGSFLDTNDNNYMTLVEALFDFKKVSFSTNFCKVTTKIFERIMENKPKDDFNKFQQKIVVWTIVSNSYIKHSKWSMDSLTPHEMNVIFKWVIWPLETFLLYEGKLETNCFEDTFCSTWGSVVSYASKATIKLSFTTNLHSTLKKLADLKKPIRNFSKLLTYFLNTIDVNYDVSSKPQITLSLLSYVISLPPFDNFSNDQIVHDIQYFLTQLNEQKIEIIFGEIVEITKNMIVAGKSKYITAKVFDNFKSFLIDKIKKMENKILFKQIKNVFSNNNDFVIIPSVWSLKPDRLTEHQKDKMKDRRSDIPALYNDMSQSEDSSSIKPWTPKKIVIAKEKEDEISIKESLDALHKNDDVESDSSTILNDESFVEINGINPFKRKTPRRVFSKEDEDLLKKLNIVIEDDKRKWLTLRELRNIKTNTVTELEQNLRKIRSEVVLLNQTKEDDNVKERKKRANNKSNAHEKNIETTESCMEEVNNDLSEALLSHRSLNLEKKKIANEKSFDPTDYGSDCINLNDVKRKTENLPTSTLETSICKVDIIPEIKLNSIPYFEPDMDELLNKTKNNDQIVLSLTSSSDDQEIIENTPIVEGTNIAIPKKKTKENEETTSLSSKELMFIKKKASTSMLSSPERKTINCSSSPVLKPKVGTHLFGRGAQLINMIRNKNVNYSLKSKKVTDTKTDESPRPDSTSQIPSANSHTPKIMNNDILIFSKVPPSSDASPSSSILKRKFRESYDNSAELPAHKRKRVSFHDPPVSLTKEYVKYDESGELNESKAKINLSRRLSAGESPKKLSSITDVKNSLKRNSRANSILEISNFSKTCTDKPEVSLIIPSCSSTLNSLTSCNNLETLIDAGVGKDENGMLDLITEKYSMESLLENYSKKKGLVEPTRCVANSILSIVKNNPKIKSEIIEKLSETYPKEFLKHAIQENLSSVVCESLTIDSIIEFIFCKSKQDTAIRNQVLLETKALLKNDKFLGDSNKHLLYLLQNNKMTNDQILKFIEILASKRSTNKS